MRRWGCQHSDMLEQKNSGDKAISQRTCLYIIVKLCKPNKPFIPNIWSFEPNKLDPNTLLERSKDFSQKVWHVCKMCHPGHMVSGDKAQDKNVFHSFSQVGSRFQIFCVVYHFFRCHTFAPIFSSIRHWIQRSFLNSLL